MSHTPGPWSVGGWEDASCSISAPRWEALAVAYGNESGEEPFVSEGIANANLIAAAPDLLAALKDLVARCDGAEGVRADGSNIQTMAAQAAIEIAEGK